MVRQNSVDHIGRVMRRRDTGWSKGDMLNLKNRFVPTGVAPLVKKDRTILVVCGVTLLVKKDRIVVVCGVIPLV